VSVVEEKVFFYKEEMEDIVREAVIVRKIDE
jgi:hypothetical protein